VRTLEFAIATASIARNILMAACHLSYDLGHHPNDLLADYSPVVWRST
jgi:hypothetical protein